MGPLFVVEGLNLGVLAAQEGVADELQRNAVDLTSSLRNQLGKMAIQGGILRLRWNIIPRFPIH
jgi:hypothetical protein